MKFIPHDYQQYAIDFIRDNGKLPMRFYEFIDEKDLSHVELVKKG